MLPDGSLSGLNPYEAIPAIRTIAEELGITLGHEPTPQEVQGTLFPMMGKGKSYVDNAEGLDIGDEIYANSRLMDALASLIKPIPLRSVHSELGVHDEKFVMLLTGATANWMERRVLESRRWAQPAAAYIAAANQPVIDNADSPNSYVKKYKKAYGKAATPQEYQLLSRIWRSVTRSEPDDVAAVSRNLDDNLVALLAKHPHIADATVYVPTNAGAVNIALQVRRKLREICPGFDSDPNKPKFYFSSDGFVLAKTPEQAAKPAQYQRPLTLLSYVPRIVNELMLLES